DVHRIGSTLDLFPVIASTLVQPAPEGGLVRIVHGGGGERAHVLCGFLGSNVPNDPLIRILPRMLKVNVADGASQSWIESSLKVLARAMAAGVVDSPAVLARVTELLFIEAVRRYLAALPEERSGWRSGLRDPFVGCALALLHGGLEDRLTM